MPGSESEKHGTNGDGLDAAAPRRQLLTAFLRDSFRRRRGGRVSPALAALSSTAILAVYAAGYVGTAGLVDDSLPAFEIAAEATAEDARPPSTPTPGAPALAETPDVGAQPQSSATPPAGATPAAAYRDGVYRAKGGGLHGYLELQVTVEGGRITAVEIRKCRTHYPCSVIDSLPDQTIERQSEKVRYVSGATESSRSYAKALAAALKQAS
jgi:uncharacterized protein with FMN-binding domain